MIISPNNPFLTHPAPSALGFIDDDFEKSVLDGRWIAITHKTPSPGAGLASEGGQQSLKISHPAAYRYDLNQSIIEGLVMAQTVNTGENFALIAEAVYPDTTFAASNSMYLGTGIIFYYDSNNYVEIEAQAHPSIGARIRWNYNDDTSGAAAGVNTSPGFSIPVTPIYLKITRSGSDFTVSVSDDDITYYDMLTRAAANLASNGNKLGVVASTYISTEANAVAWDAYWRSIKETLST